MIPKKTKAPDQYSVSSIDQERLGVFERLATRATRRLGQPWLREIAVEVMEVAEAAEEPKLPDEPEALTRKDYRCPSVEEEEGGADGDGRSASVIIIAEDDA